LGLAALRYVEDSERDVAMRRTTADMRCFMILLRELVGFDRRR